MVLGTVDSSAFTSSRRAFDNTSASTNGCEAKLSTRRDDRERSKGSCRTGVPPSIWRVQKALASLIRSSRTATLICTLSEVPSLLVGRSSDMGPCSYRLPYTLSRQLLLADSHEDALYAAPDPRRTAGKVLARISKSSHNDQLRMYCKSNSIHFSKVVELRPLICHKQVIPGRTLKRLRCQSPQYVSNSS